MRSGLGTRFRSSGATARIHPDRQLDPHGQASAPPSAEVNVSAVFPDDRPGDGETETNPARAWIAGVAAPVEGLEHLLALAPGNSRAFVLDEDREATSLGSERDVGLAAILDRIVHQIGNRPPHGRWPAGYRHAARPGEGHLLTGVRGILADALDEGRQIHQRCDLSLCPLP